MESDLSRLGVVIHSLMPSLEMLLKDQEFKVILSYVASSRSAWAL